MGNCNCISPKTVVTAVEGDIDPKNSVFQYDKDTRKIVYIGEDTIGEGHANLQPAATLSASHSASTSDNGSVGGRSAGDTSHNGANGNDKNDENLNENLNNVRSLLGEIAEYLDEDESTIGTRSVGNLSSVMTPTGSHHPHQHPPLNQQNNSQQQQNQTRHDNSFVSTNSRQAVSPLLFDVEDIQIKTPYSDTKNRKYQDELMKEQAMVQNVRLNTDVRMHTNIRSSSPSPDTELIYKDPMNTHEEESLLRGPFDEESKSMHHPYHPNVNQGGRDDRTSCVPWQSKQHPHGDDESSHETSLAGIEHVLSDEYADSEFSGRNLYDQDTLLGHDAHDDILSEEEESGIKITHMNTNTHTSPMAKNEKLMDQNLSLVEEHENEHEDSKPSNDASVSFGSFMHVSYMEEEPQQEPANVLKDATVKALNVDRDLMVFSPDPPMKEQPVREQPVKHQVDDPFEVVREEESEIFDNDEDEPHMEHYEEQPQDMSHSVPDDERDRSNDPALPEMFIEVPGQSLAEASDALSKIPFSPIENTTTVNIATGIRDRNEVLADDSSMSVSDIVQDILCPDILCPSPQRIQGKGYTYPFNLDRDETKSKEVGKNQNRQEPQATTHVQTSILTVKNKELPSPKELEDLDLKNEETNSDEGTEITTDHYVNDTVEHDLDEIADNVLENKQANDSQIKDIEYEVDDKKKISSAHEIITEKKEPDSNSTQDESWEETEEDINAKVNDFMDEMSLAVDMLSNVKQGEGDEFSIESENCQRKEEQIRGIEKEVTVKTEINSQTVKEYEPDDNLLVDEDEEHEDEISLEPSIERIVESASQEEDSLSVETMEHKFQELQSIVHSGSAEDKMKKQKEIASPAPSDERSPTSLKISEYDEQFEAEFDERYPEIANASQLVESKVETRDYAPVEDRRRPRTPPRNQLRPTPTKSSLLRLQKAGGKNISVTPTRTSPRRQGSKPRHIPDDASVDSMRSMRSITSTKSARTPTRKFNGQTPTPTKSSLLRLQVGSPSRSNSSSSVMSGTPNSMPWDETKNKKSSPSGGSVSSVNSNWSNPGFIKEGRKKAHVRAVAVRSAEKSKKCTRKWDPYLFETKRGCVRCLSLASVKERNKYYAEGRHPRISMTRAGCHKSCPKSRKFMLANPDLEVGDDQCARLCRICFNALHR